MRKFNLMVALISFIFGFAVITFRLIAGVESNSVCQAAGGCSFPCSNADSGSANLISASQVTQCSPQYYSTCTPGTSYGVCGVYYQYSGQNCDPTTITNSYYDYNYFCSSD
jgi:hypothetical protein